MNTNPKGFAPIVIILAVISFLAVSGVAAWYFIQTAKPKTAPAISQKPVQQAATIQPNPPSPQNTAVNSTNISNWQTYRNDQYGFEIKYPDNFFVNTTSEGTVEFADKQWQGQEIHYSLVFIEAIATDLTPRGLVAKKGTAASMFDETANPECNKEPGGCEYFSVKDQKDVNIGLNRLTAFQFSNTATSASNDNTMIQDMGSGRIINIARHTSSNGEVPPEIYNQILSTFQFVKPQGGSDTSSWRTFSDAKNGFEMKIPPVLDKLGLKISAESSAFLNIAAPIIVIYANGSTAKAAQCNQEQFARFAIAPESFCGQNTKICEAIRGDDIDKKIAADVTFDNVVKESDDKILVSIGCSSCGDAWDSCGWSSPEIKTAYEQMLSTFKFTESQK